MNLVKLGWKLFAREETQVSPPEFAAVFNAWIARQARDELLLDVADYKHVAEGPGVVLIAEGGHYGMERTGERLGLTYRRLRPVAGDGREAARFGLFLTLRAALALEAEAALRGRLAFTTESLQCTLYDGRIAPGDAAAEAWLQQTLGELLAGPEGRPELAATWGPRLTLEARWPATRVPTPAQLLARLPAESGGAPPLPLPPGTASR